MTGRDFALDVRSLGQNTERLSLTRYISWLCQVVMSSHALKGWIPGARKKKSPWSLESMEHYHQSLGQWHDCCCYNQWLKDIIDVINTGIFYSNPYQLVKQPFLFQAKERQLRDFLSHVWWRCVLSWILLNKFDNGQVKYSDFLFNHNISYVGKISFVNICHCLHLLDRVI